MREIKIRLPGEDAERVANLALAHGADSVAAHEVFVHGKGERMHELKIKTSTPHAKRIVDALLAAPFFNPARYVVSSHDIRALISTQAIEPRTRPVCVPRVDVHQDLWQNSHFTWSFALRVAVSSALVAYAMLREDLVLMIGALIFSPFSPVQMGLGFSLCVRDRALAGRAAKTFALGLVLAIAAAAVAAAVTRGPLMYDRLGQLGDNAVISLLAGFMGAFAESDDVGRRQLLGLAAAYPFVKFPVWIGIACVLGFPALPETAKRLGMLGVDVLAMVLAAAVGYWAVGMRKSFSAP
jgi:hypothetical protein